MGGLFAFALLSYILVPFSGDIDVMLGSSRLADYYDGGLIYNSFNSWELKGVLQRLTNYTFYKIITLFFPCPSVPFTILFSIIYA